MKILDRYITISLFSAFASGVAMFLVLLMAMNLLQKLIEMITEEGIPVGTALVFFVYRIPSVFIYVFPMSVLLGILLVFNKMSSDSEMVAIRAAGVSFIRIIIPAILFSAVISLLTVWISDRVAPAATERATRLVDRVKLQIKPKDNLVCFTHIENEKLLYSFVAKDFNLERQELRQLSLTYYKDGVPTIFLYADQAHWRAKEGRWTSPKAVIADVSQNSHLPPATASDLFFDSPAMQLKASPFDIDMASRKPDDVPSKDIKRIIVDLTQDKSPRRITDNWKMQLALRFSVPFACLVFAFIGAPLGLRHHRTSSSVGLGISLLIIMVYYFVAHYMAVFGEGGQLNPWIAAWIPNALGIILGIILIIRANR